TEVVTDISDIDNPYASVVNVVWDPDKGQYFYIVERGDTLSEISGEVHVSVDQLVDINSIHNPNLIYTDESLALP
ncbi:MAG TPA: LysM domain-containing protein, partial [Lachnospiraceae bacterium]|nr:LysM domain-containing protein [Lachnospiraceae bacterium]